MAGTEYLLLRATFLAGTYGGEEWPPAPFRLLQAIVAGCRGIEAPGLAWVERQAPPTILAQDDPAVLIFKRAIPNNADPRKPQAQHSMREVVHRPISAPVHYVWTLHGAEDRAQALQLADTASRVHTFGTGVDMCSVEGAITMVAPESGPSRACWVPQPEAVEGALHRDGDHWLQVPVAGSLVSLEERFQAFQRRLDNSRDGYARPVPGPALHRVACYRRSEHHARHALLALRLLSPDGGEEFRRFHATEAVVIGGMLRHAAMRVAAGRGRALEDFAAGYPPADSPDARLSWVPLPSVGHRHADGLIRRGLWLCRAVDSGSLQMLVDGLPPGPVPLLDQDSGECVALAAPVAAGSEPVLGAYLQRARVWSTVTPIVLPGDYGGGNPRVMTRLLHKAIREAGIDPGLVEGVQLSRFPPLRRGVRVSDVRLKDWKAKNLILTHARLRLRAPIHGPVVLGRGRHYGLGLMCANTE